MLATCHSVCVPKNCGCVWLLIKWLEDNQVKVLEDNQVSCDLERNMFDFPQHVAVDEDLRSASTDADKKLSDFQVKMSATVQRVVVDVIAFLDDNWRPFLIFFF